MNISTNTLLELKCCECGCYLSRIPIYVGEDGTAICGRCDIPISRDSNASKNQIPAYYRMMPYENLIKEIIFPCMYQNSGCTVKMLSKDLQDHEENCNYRLCTCPFISSGNCNWIGRKEKLIVHCKAQHVDRLLQHPCNFKHNYKMSSFETYIAIIFDILFLINAKVCLTTNKIYYSVNCFGNISNHFNTKFKLVIQRESEQITKYGKITPFNPKENVCISCDIQSLVEILNGSDNTNFTIHIENKQKNKCAYCNSFNYTVNEDKFCEMCDSIRIKCDKCGLKDIKVKTDMHRTNFCKYARWCWVCNSHLVIFPLQNRHYEENHKDVIYSEDNYWNISESNFKNVNGNIIIDFIIDSKYDRFFGAFTKLGEYYNLKICCSTIQSEEASKLTCKVSIKNNLNDDVKYIFLYYDYQSKYDWNFNFPRGYLFLDNVSCQIKIEFLKE